MGAALVQQPSLVFAELLQNAAADFAFGYEHASHAGVFGVLMDVGWREGLLVCIQQHTELSIGLDDAAAHVGHERDTCHAQAVQDVLWRQAKQTQHVGIKFSVSNDHTGVAAQQAADADAFSAETGEQHFHGEQCDERDDAAEQRDGGVLQGNGGKLGNQNGNGKFRGGQLTELSFSGKPQTANDCSIDEQCAREQQKQENHLPKICF